MGAASSKPGLMRRVMGALHRPVYESRLRALTAEIVPLLREGERVLDVGCGFGALGRAIMDAPACPAGVRVEGLERHPRGSELIPVTGYAGGPMPFGDGSFDVVIVADVLHHEEHPHRLLAECARVAGREVIIKDHALRGPLARQRVSLIDWAATAPYGVRCLYRYNTHAEWSEWARRHGMRITMERASMNLYPPLVNLLFGRGLQYLAVWERDEARRPAGGAPGARDSNHRGAREGQPA